LKSAQKRCPNHLAFTLTLITSIGIIFVRIFIIILVISIITACTAKRVIEITPEQLQKQISSGQLFQKGDVVKITTTDNKTYEFAVTEVTDDAIAGDNTSVPINALSSVELRRKVMVDKDGVSALGMVILIFMSVANPMGGGFAPVP
jgi:hypothetical protein